MYSKFTRLPALHWMCFCWLLRRFVLFSRFDWRLEWSCRTCQHHSFQLSFVFQKNLLYIWLSLRQRTTSLVVFTNVCLFNRPNTCHWIIVLSVVYFRIQRKDENYKSLFFNRKIIMKKALLFLYMRSSLFAGVTSQ